MNSEPVSFRGQFDELDNDISIHNSQQDFLSHISKINESIKIPTLINDEISYQKESFSKLKFQYLEQETKEKYLRSLFDSPPLSVDQEDINNMKNENINSKQKLKALKVTMEKKMNDIQELSRETVQLNEEYQDKYSETNKTLAQLDNMEEKINSIIDNQREETKQIIKCLIDLSSNTNDKDLTKIMENVNNKTLQVDSGLQVANELHLKKQLSDNQQQSLQKLQEKLVTLKSSLLSIKSNEEPNENQIFAQWVKEMNEFLINLNSLSYIRFEFDDSSDLKIFVGHNKIILDKNFTILNVNELSKFENIVRKINSNESKMQNFLILVNDLLEI